METLKLVREFNCNNIKAVNESLNGSDNWTIEGIGIQMGIKNGNGRVYVREPMIEQLNEYKRDYLDKNRAVAELEHPTEPDDQVKINIDRICAKFTDMMLDGDNVYLKAKVTDGTPCGDILKNLLKNGVQLGFSSRALAKLEKKKDYVETWCRKIIALADIVYDPSAPDAFIQGVMEERDWVYQNGVIMEAKNFEQVVEDSKLKFSNMTSKNKDSIVKDVMKKYFDKLFAQK